MTETQNTEILISWATIAKFVTAAALSIALLVLAAHLLRFGFDFYPQMGVHSAHIIVGHHFCFAGWVQTTPHHVAFRAACNG